MTINFLTSIIQEMLEYEGCEVMSANDGIAGYSAFLLFDPDLIITDIQMPGENGFAMMERIRTHSPMIKTIYITGDISSSWASLIEETKKYPVTFLEKPFALDSLKQLISGAAVNSMPMIAAALIEDRQSVPPC